MTAKVSELITRVKSRISLPDNDDRFSPSEIVDVMNDVMEESVLPELMKYNEEYLMLKKVVPLRDNDGAIYPDLLIPVPRRTYGLTLREIKYRNPNDGGSGSQVNLPYINPEDEELRNNIYGTGTQNHALGFFFQGAAVKILGNADSLDGSIVFTYITKPSVLVNTNTLFGPVTNMSFSGSIMTFTTASITGTEFNTAFPTATSALVDIYHTQSGHLLAADVVMARSGTSFTTSDLEVNDLRQFEAYQQGGFPVSGAFSSQLYIVPAGQNQYSGLPKEYDNVLIYYTCQRILESLGDTEGLQVNQTQLERAQNSIQSAYGKRIAGENKKVVNRRGLLNSLVRRGRYSRWGKF